MGRNRTALALGTALTTAALAAGALALAPAASAVDPATATLTADCGSAGSGKATLKATQDGTSATITASSGAVKAPVDVSANSVSTTLTMTDKDGKSVTFTGKSNPAMKSGDDVNSGPLKGTVAKGQALEASTLKLSVGVLDVTCKATSKQDPGPFTF